MTFNDKEFSKMAWALLEYCYVYHNYNDGLGGHIDRTWIELRSITDEEYDAKLRQYESECVARNQKPTAGHEVSFDLMKPSRKLVAEKLSKPISLSNIPIYWPHEPTETLAEKLFRLQQSANKLGKKKTKKTSNKSKNQG